MINIDIFLILIVIFYQGRREGGGRGRSALPQPSRSVLQNSAESPFLDGKDRPLGQFFFRPINIQTL